MPIKTAIRKIIKMVVPYGMVRIIQKHNEAKIIKLNENKSERKSYYCKALSGLSGYNFSINSDMTVSCSCCASNNEALLGNLNEQSLYEIFRGEKAERMRDDLLAGTLPVHVCRGCTDLVEAPYFVSGYYNSNFRMNNNVMIENCSLCNYKCADCTREHITAGRTSGILSAENIEKIAKELNKNNISIINLFKLGEPFLDNDICEKVKILKKHNPDAIISMSTNGMMINNDSKIKAALLLDYIEFSIDGVNTEIQNKYQKGSDFDKIIDNVKRIRAARGNGEKPVMIWKYVVFSWNDDEQSINEVFAKAASYGFDKVLLTYGVTSNIPAKSVRYFSPHFIPSNIEQKFEMFESYGDGRGMMFDLKKLQA